MTAMVTHRKTTEQSVAAIPHSEVLADADAATAFPHIRVQRATTTVGDLEGTAATERYAATAEPAEPAPIDPDMPVAHSGSEALAPSEDPAQTCPALEGRCSFTDHVAGYHAAPERSLVFSDPTEKATLAVQLTEFDNEPGFPSTREIVVDIDGTPLEHSTPAAARLTAERVRGFAALIEQAADELERIGTTPGAVPRSATAPFCDHLDGQCARHTTDSIGGTVFHWSAETEDEQVGLVQYGQDEPRLELGDDSYDLAGADALIEARERQLAALRLHRTHLVAALAAREAAA
jgi:hypothetical protein